MNLLETSMASGIVSMRFSTSNWEIIWSFQLSSMPLTAVIAPTAHSVRLGIALSQHAWTRNIPTPILAAIRASCNAVSTSLLTSSPSRTVPVRNRFQTSISSANATSGWSSLSRARPLSCHPAMPVSVVPPAMVHQARSSRSTSPALARTSSLWAAQSGIASRTPLPQPHSRNWRRLRQHASLAAADSPTSSPCPLTRSPRSQATSSKSDLNWVSSHTRSSSKMGISVGWRAEYSILVDARTPMLELLVTAKLSTPMAPGGSWVEHHCLHLCGELSWTWLMRSVLLPARAP